LKIRSTKVDAGDFKHELLNRLRSTMAVNVLISRYLKHTSCLLQQGEIRIINQKMYF